MKTQAIIPAAGMGVRLKSSVIKPLILLAGKPILIYSLEILQSCSLVESIILVGPKNHLADFRKMIQRYRLNKVKAIIAGGATRAESVRNGLACLDEDTELVLIHDGVRPLVTKKIVEAAVRLAQRHSAVVAAVPVKPTIKKINPKTLCVEETLDRNILWEAQTPQIFRRDLLEKAHAKPNSHRGSPTDDAMMVEALGIRVRVLPGDEANIKITTPEDLTMAAALLKARKN